MSKERIYEWWIENKFKEYCDYMLAYVSPYNSKPENHSERSIRTDRTISFFDQQSRGFIGQYLFTKYAMEFVDSVTDKYYIEAKRIAFVN